MLKILCLILIQAFAQGPLSQPLVRDYGQTIGNGGGVGELQITRSWNELKGELQFCAAPFFLCGLQASQWQVLNQALQNKERCFPELAFQPLPSNQIVLPVACGQKLIFNSALLLNNKISPLSADRVTAFTLQALCVSSGNCNPATVAIFMTALKTLVSLVSWQTLDNNSALIQKRIDQEDQLILLQGQSSDNLTDLLKSRLSCAVGLLKNFQIMDSSVGRGILAPQWNARVRFVCGSRPSDRRITLTLRKAGPRWVLQSNDVFVY